MNEIADLKRRIDSLERQSRRWQQWFFGLLIGAVALSLMGAAPILNGDKQEKISVESIDVGRLRIVDQNNVPRIELAVDEDIPAIRLSDGNKAVRGAFFVSSDGSAISLQDKREKTRALLSAMGDKSELKLFDEDGETWAALSDLETRKEFVVKGANSQVGAVLDNKSASFLIGGVNGRQRVVSRVDEEGPHLGILDERGTVIFHKP